MREEVYRMERVTYCEQGVALLENFSMAIWTGEILGLVPANCCGCCARTCPCTMDLFTTRKGWSMTGVFRVPA